MWTSLTVRKSPISVHLSKLYRKPPSTEVKLSASVWIGTVQREALPPASVHKAWKKALAPRVRFNLRKPDRIWTPGGQVRVLLLMIDRLSDWHLVSCEITCWLNPSSHALGCLSFCSAKDSFAKITPPRACNFSKFWILGIIYLTATQPMFQ